MRKMLKSTKQRDFNKKVFGFDIETCDNNKTFLCASLVSDDYEKVFYTPQAFAEEVKTNPIFKNSVVFATNLSFDFFGTFFNSVEAKNFKTVFRGSSLIYVKSYFYKGNFYPYAKVKSKSLKSITFLDSMNYVPLSVAKMGQILKMSKFEKPDFLGQRPQDKEEWKQLVDYNIRDSLITYRFCEFLITSFESFGATFKNTIASTSLSLFKNKYLEDIYFQPSESILMEQFASYYGGRTEAFKRGTIKNYKYYDINSLYPSVMRDFEYPNPNSLRCTQRNEVKYIKEYEGISKVTIECPQDMLYPLLPHRELSGRVLFPTGKLEGWYTHVELRKAMEIGYILIKVHQTQYFTHTIKPFEGFVNDLYNLRLQYQAEKSPMELVAKLLMNSLYGKFAQKFLGMDNWIHESLVKESDLLESTTIERKGEYIRLVQDGQPSSFCIPIWSSYVTAYGRIRLYDYIQQHNPAYVDTDSIITEDIIPESKELGKMKLEMNVREGIIVRPKFYALINDDKEQVKIKGLGKRLSYLEFVGLLHHPMVKYDKFTKFKEALRRDLIPNEIIEVSKEFSLEDEKRVWSNVFDHTCLEESRPLLIQRSDA